MKRLLSVAFGALLSALSTAGDARAALAVDQQCTASSTGGYSASTFVMSQSFTPETTSLDTVEIALSNTDQSAPSTAVVFVRIRIGSVGGDVLGESPQVSIPFGRDYSTDGWVIFSFSPALALTPGSTYFFEIVHVSGGNPAIMSTFLCQYAGGQLFRGGAPTGDNLDMLFREGVTVADAPDVDTILSDFEDAIDGGQIVGSGPGESAGGKLNAMRNKLEAIKSLVTADDLASACDEIASALAKTDGAPNPPDMVAGTGAAELASALAALWDDLGCAR